MAAGNEGGGREGSFGLNISLPFEQKANPWVHGSERLVNFNYFFTRKLFFIKEADAIVLLPGGFGTMDEGFEALTLIQTGKDDPTPVVFLDRPGGTYWKNWFQFVRENLLSEGLVSFEDRSLFLITDDVEEACNEIVNFYRRYHSCRFVNNKKQLVIRLKDELSDAAILRLNRQFKDLLAQGEIESCTAFEEELNEPETLHLPRLALHFDQRHYSRLRELIDAINRIS